MPVLEREIDLYPQNLFELIENRVQVGDDIQPDRWWVLYTLSRREKELMRQLRGLSISFYGPMVAKRSKTPSGRVYTAYKPLFRNYVFVYGDDEARYTSMKTNCVSNYVPVTNALEFTRELKQFQTLINMDVPLLPEARLQAGQRIRIRAGRFRGFEGIIVRREHEIRLLVAINFIQQGASILLDDFEVEAI